MSVKVKDVLNALQQMQKTLECSIWYERTVALFLSICFNRLQYGLMQPIDSTTFSLSPLYLVMHFVSR